MVPSVVHEVLQSPGAPLDHSTRSRMESTFGYDFSRVRVHTDAKAAESAAVINAHAYTAGTNMVFASGRYQPSTSHGRQLLAHELTHVVQQGGASAHTNRDFHVSADTQLEHEAETVANTIESAPAQVHVSSSVGPEGAVRRRVIAENVTCNRSGLRNPNLTGAEAVAAIAAADNEAITLARRAELLLDWNLLFARAGDPVNAEFDTILQEELGLTLTNPAHFRLIEQQRDRFTRVRTTLESGFLRYMCRGGTVSLVGCEPGNCGVDFAFTCPGNRLVVLCQAFWDAPEERAGTILHEPFHIWFDMARHQANALRRADATCFEAFARRLAGENVDHISCRAHTAG